MRQADRNIVDMLLVLPEHQMLLIDCFIFFLSTTRKTDNLALIVLVLCARHMSF